MIVARTSEGRVRARTRGVKLGPKYKLTLGQRAWGGADGYLIKPFSPLELIEQVEAFLDGC